MRHEFHRPAILGDGVIESIQAFEYIAAKEMRRPMIRIAAE